MAGFEPTTSYLVSREGFEPPASWFVARHSIQTELTRLGGYNVLYPVEPTGIEPVAFGVPRRRSTK